MHGYQPVSLAQLGVPEWDRFVQAQPHGTFFHLAGWEQVIRRAFGHRTHYLAARQAGRTCAVMPLVEIRSALFGHYLASTPFCVYGGPVGEPAACNWLLQQARQQAAALRVDYLEVRSLASELPSLQPTVRHARFVTPLGDSPEAILAGIKKKQRAVIRHALKEGFDYRFEQDSGRFFRVYSESVRNLGTPVFPRRYFKLLLEVFAGQSDILTVEHRGKPVSSVLNFYFRDQVLPYYGGGVLQARELKSNDFMYYTLMCEARARGCGWFDFGRSKLGSGAYKYKQHWGITPAPVAHHYHLVTAPALPNLSPANPRYQLFIRLWQRLPLVISQQLGPLLSRSLG